MARPLPKDGERWEDPIVAEVRKAREGLFAAAGYDLDELGRRLNEQQQREGRTAIMRPSRQSRPHAVEGPRSQPKRVRPPVK